MFHPLAALLIGSALAAPAAVEADRRDRQSPEIFVEPNGRTGTCDAILFNAEGTTLFTGGDDKVVRAWPVTDKGFGAIQTLRWPAWREYRGGIKALAISPDSKLVAIGGFPTRSANGTVSIVKWPTGETVAQTLLVPQGEPSYTVFAMKFSPKGKYLAIGTSDGRIWWWDHSNEKTAVEIGRHPPFKRNPDAPAEFNRVRHIAFPDGDSKRLVSIGSDGGVLEHTLNEGVWASKELMNVAYLGSAKKTDGFSVFQAAVSPDGKWIAAGCQNPGVLILRSLVDHTQWKRKKFEDGQFSSALAFNVSGDRLAISVGVFRPLAQTSNFVIEGDDPLYLIENPLVGDGHDLTWTEITTPRYRTEGLAFHPDGRLAVAYGLNHDVKLWNLDDLKSPQEQDKTKGVGRCLWGVRVSTTGEAIGIQPQRDPAAVDPNKRGTGPWVGYDLSLTKVSNAKHDWVEPVTQTADGWTLQATASQYDWQLLHKDLQVPYTIPWDRDRDESPRCYTFLPPAKPGGPNRVAVGHMYGLSVYEFTLEKPPERVMWGKGHSGEVMTLGPSKDGSWLVTAGNDQTIAAWNMQDWSSGNSLGASLKVADGKLMVTGVEVGSPAWEMGLSKDAEILMIGTRDKLKRETPYVVAGATVEDESPPSKAFGTPEAGLAKLNAARPSNNFSLFLVWKGKDRERVSRGQTTLPTRPIWRMFPAFDEKDRLTEWVVWIWATGHYHTSTNGDFLIGWHVNRPVETQTPKFYRAEQMRGLYQREGVVRKLLNQRNLGDALEDLLGKNPLLPKFDESEPDPVTLTVDSKEIGPKGVTVTVDVPARGTNPDLWADTVEVWVNDYRVKLWITEGRSLNAEKVVIEPRFLRAGKNTITAFSLNKLGGRAEDQKVVTKPGDKPQPRLFGLTVGINDYSQSIVSPESLTGPTASTGKRDVLRFANLHGAKNDATVLKKTWLEHVGTSALYSAGDIAFVEDPQATRKNIVAALEKVARDATADDRFILFLAGHGDYLPVMQRNGKMKKEFVFCCQDYDRVKRPLETGVRAADLIDLLAKIPCRKVVILDACHSGQAASTNLIRELVPNGQGPVVFAACDQSEYALELRAKGHGVFTYAILSALGPDQPADKNKNGRLEVGELTEYVQNKMPELLRLIDPKLTGDEQTPQQFPRSPEPFEVASKK